MSLSSSLRNPYVTCALAVVGILLVGLLDLASGVELRIYPLYFLPLSLGAWNLGRAGTVLLSALIAVVWTVCNASAGLVYSQSAVWFVNIGAQLVGAATVGLLIVELRARARAEAGLSRVDPLTGLANARAFLERLELVRAMSSRNPRPFTIAYIDLDEFKLVNDSLGHAEGDAVLCAVARCLRASCRATDLAARVGGDELTLLLPDTDQVGAARSVEAFRDSFRAVAAGRGWPVTASIGVLIVSGVDPPPADELLRQADGLMYRAKREGKDRVHVEVLASTLPAAIA